MKNLTFRTLRADEIELRVAQISEKGLSLLAYKDARCDTRIMNETFGMMNWEANYELIDGQLFCTVKIWDDDKKTWIAKQNVGEYTDRGLNSSKDPSDIPNEPKSRASDALKRACFTWGLGIELYDMPFIWIPANKCDIKPGKNGKPTTYDKFKVSEIAYDESKRVVCLTIKNTKTGAVVFQYGTKTAVQEKPVPETTKKPVPEKASPERIKVLRDLLSKTTTIFGDETGIPEHFVCVAHKVEKLEDLNARQVESDIKNIDKIADKYVSSFFDAGFDAGTPAGSSTQFTLPRDCIHA